MWTDNTDLSPKLVAFWVLAREQEVVQQLVLVCLYRDLLAVDHDISQVTEISSVLVGDFPAYLADRRRGSLKFLTPSTAAHKSVQRTAFLFSCVLMNVHSDSHALIEIDDEINLTFEGHAADCLKPGWDIAG